MADDDLKSMKDRLTTITVLLVEDTPYFRTLLCNFLEPLRVKKIIEARNGKEARDVLLKETVDLIICDWKMPEMDGLELLRLVRSHEDWTKIPFIMLTGKADKTVVVECVRLKVADFLVKPVDAKTLARKVLKALAAAPPRAGEAAGAEPPKPAQPGLDGPQPSPDEGGEPAS
jgi:CheY-like chemotaxis protein